MTVAALTSVQTYWLCTAQCIMMDALGNTLSLFHNVCCQYFSFLHGDIQVLQTTSVQLFLSHLGSPFTASELPLYGLMRDSGVLLCAKNGIRRNINVCILTLPLTLCIGSTTTATARSDRASKLCCVLMSTPDSQQPKPGCEWYQPTTISGLQ